MSTSIHNLTQLVAEHQAGRLDLATIKTEVERERAERERETFSPFNGFGSAAAWVSFLNRFEAMTDTELDAALKAELAGGRRQFELTAIGREFYRRGNLDALNGLVVYCARLTRVYQIARWCNQNKQILEQ